MNRENYEAMSKEELIEAAMCGDALWLMVGRKGLPYDICYDDYAIIDKTEPIPEGYVYDEDQCTYRLKKLYIYTETDGWVKKETMDYVFCADRRDWWVKKETMD